MENEIRTEKKDTTKEKIILFIIGVLVGAVISTAAFFVYTKTLGTNNSSTSQSSGMQSGTPPEMPGGNSSNQGGTPPEMPGSTNSGNNSSNSTNNSSSTTSSNSNTNSSSTTNSGSSTTNTTSGASS